MKKERRERKRRGRRMAKRKPTYERSENNCIVSFVISITVFPKTHFSPKLDRSL
jgi:hypothetical protein